MACDFCGKPSRELVSLRDIFKKYLPKKYEHMCPTCEKKVNSFLWKKMAETDAAAWRATAAFAVDLKE